MRYVLALAIIGVAYFNGVLTLAEGANPSPDAPKTVQSPTTGAALLVDRIGDPLPPGAVTRLGSTRLRHLGLGEFALTHDGKSAVTTGADNMVRAWDLTTGRQTRAVPLQGQHPQGSLTATLSRDGKTVAGLAQNKQLFVWDAESGRTVKTLDGPVKNNVNYIWFSPDGNTVIMDIWNPNSVLLVEWQTGRERLVSLPARPYGVPSSLHATFSPDGKWFVAGGGNGYPVCVFETGNWKEVHRLMCDAWTSAVAPDSKTLVLGSRQSGGGAGSLRLFDLATGRETASFPMPGILGWLAFTPNGKTLACGNSANSCLVDLANGRVLHQLNCPASLFEFTPDGKTIVGKCDGGLRLWDVASGAEKLELPPGIGGDTVTAVSPDGRLIATTQRMGGVVLWDMIDGRLVRTLPLGREVGYFCDLAFSPDGGRLSAGQSNGVIHVCNVANGQAERSFRLTEPGRGVGKATQYYGLRITADSQRVATLEHGVIQPPATRLAVWDGANGRLTGQQFMTLQNFTSTQNKIWSWSADDATMAVLVGTGLTIYDGAQLHARHQITSVPPSGPVAVSPSGQLIIAQTKVNGADAVGVWDVGVGRPVTTVSTGKCTRLALAADDRTLVTLGDGVLRIWDLATERERGHWELPMVAATVIVTLDGRRAVTTLNDGTGLVWDLTAFPTERLTGAFGAKEVSALWDELVADDAKTVHAAKWRLAEGPADDVVPFLMRQLRPTPLDAGAIRQAVAGLDSPLFATRDAATRRLEKMGGAIVPTLRQALAGTKSAETQARLRGLIDRLSGPLATPHELRRLRAICVLEQFGTVEARRLLAELADAPVHPQEARAARASLDRLKARQP